MRKYAFLKTGAFAELETELNEMSAQGFQIRKAGRLCRQYEKENGAYLHRIGYCAAGEGSADDITYTKAQERAGWSVCLRKKGWIIFRKPAEHCTEDERLADDREPMAALFERRIKKAETARMYLIVLASGLLLAGYVTDILPLMYGCALPLAAAAILTYCIKFMEEGIKQ